MTVHPEDLAEQLPDRPLKAAECEDLADQFAWSIQTVTRSVGERDDVVGQWFAFRATEGADAEPGENEEVRGDALALHWDGDAGEWSGEMVREDVSLAKWAEVCDKWADYFGVDREDARLSWETDDGETRTRELRDE